jgi:hypothetical protein
MGEALFKRFAALLMLIQAELILCKLMGFIDWPWTKVFWLYLTFLWIIVTLAIIGVAWLIVTTKKEEK